ncbi:tetratricopeptide repeat protein [Piscinibacter koreensis]|uniref:Tetratricopeptide repeat protein n=1 Tax=Piscinibacter koreensis TaxID=2742824 RepID=A0A7Y6NQT8_9BURK|nr:tetratricopeptide repeat protein [Schlegelella koreensis]NUZ07635.1 tetratricopeptide repeat protein [Schlegelella koreensis]
MTPTRSLLGCVLLAACIGAAQANDLDEVNRLNRAGHPDAALTLADRLLAQNPKDARLRFAKANVLADLGRSPEAIALLQGLNEDYPELAEPYNNLASLYAAGGDYARARAALEEALRVNPGYAAARENLGDVYAMLAAQAYAEALRLEPRNTGVPPKLALVRQLAKPASPPAPRAPG